MAHNHKETSKSHFCGVGLYDPKNGFNIGACIRALGCFGGSFLAIHGERYKEYKTDFRNTDPEGSRKQFPCFFGGDTPLESFVPYDCSVVVLERTEGATPLHEFEHPRRAFYVFGPEDGSVPKDIFPDAPRICIDTEGSLNLGVAVNLTLHDRRVRGDFSTGIECPECKSELFKIIDKPAVDENIPYWHCISCGYEGLSTCWTI